MNSTILIVDDDMDIQGWLVDLLREEGYRTRAVANGVEGIAALYQTSYRPSLILLDIDMPYMDGAAFRDAQQRDSEIAAIPVILLSGIADIPSWATRLNVSDYLSKPIQIESLLALVARYCPLA